MVSNNMYTKRFSVGLIVFILWLYIQMQVLKASLVYWRLRSKGLMFQQNKE